ncbi:MAG TPA: thioredoxin domain-containing protein [Rhizomicrobium sp.]|nr:thioredoxin domain-containing protein [Rhizomicrobium sp.]
MSALDNATSPYLLAHKDKPVAWRVWSTDLLAEAEREGKPIFLSLGYAACHWCHVMNRESFSDPETAKLLNENFIPVIADRVQRPDLDQLYQAAANAMGHAGGWPLNIFLTGKGLPFFVVGYLPKEERLGQPAFSRLLTDIAALYRDKPDEVARNAQVAYERVATLLDRDMRGQAEAIQLDVAAMRMGQRYDIFLGGQIGQMKFPQTIFLETLWRAYLRTGIQQFVQLITTTMDASVLGGLYDHVGGGFFRYTMDERWLVPHFEKMLADNALMIEFLTSMWQFNRSGLCRQRLEESVAWLLRDLLMDGAFAAGLEAESEGEEGKYYLWSEAEVDAALSGTFAQRFKAVYGITRDGNHLGRNLPRRMGHLQPQLSQADDVLLAKQRGLMLAARDKRVRPARDETLLADWNGLAISALAQAGAALDHPDWVLAAVNAFDTVVKILEEGNRLYHSANGGNRGSFGFADDYALMARAALHLWEVTGEQRFLDAARRWVATLDTHFWNSEKGGYCTTADDAETLIVRARVLYDQAIPSANGIMIGVLTRLGMITGEGAYGERARALLDGFADEYGRAWASCASYINGFENFATGSQLVIVGPRNNPRTQELIKTVWGKALPNRLLYVVETGEALPMGHPAFGKGMQNGAPTAYLCQRNICSPPITSAVTLSQALTLPPRPAAAGSA